jgi:hypothetical protein
MSVATIAALASLWVVVATLRERRLSAARGSVYQHNQQHGLPNYARLPGRAGRVPDAGVSLTSTVRWLMAAGLVGCAVACAAERERIVVQPTEPTMGGITPTCELEDHQLTLVVSATCVVDTKQRVVVIDADTDELLCDSQPPPPLPNFPKQPAFVRIALPCLRLSSLPKGKRVLDVQLSGKCGSEAASGSFTCTLLPEDPP